MTSSSSADSLGDPVRATFEDSKGLGEGWKEFLWGGLAGAFGETVMHPVDTLKTWIQTAGQFGYGQQKQTNIRHVMKSVLAIDGIGGLYRGIIPGMAGSLVTGATYFGFIESTKGWLEEKRPDLAGPWAHFFAGAAGGGRRGGRSRRGRHGDVSSIIETSSEIAQASELIPPTEQVEITHVETFQDVEIEKHDDGKGEDGSDDEFDQDIPATLSEEHGGVLLRKLSKFENRQAPMIPLCRLKINTKVRTLRTDKEDLKRALRDEGYVKEKGMFILSERLSDGQVVEVTDEIKNGWGSNWLEVNEEFERELEDRPEFSILSIKMFFVWEGNHRTAAWMEIIADEFWNDRSKHTRVMASFIEPDPGSEIQLVAALQRLNLLNEDAIVKTNLKDYLYNARTICECGEESFMENLTSEEQKKLETYRRMESKSGKKPWYPLTRVMLGRMVYAPLYKKDCQAKVADLSSSLLEGERREKEKTIIRDVSIKYGRKMAKVLSIVNPSLGKQWFEVLWAMPFESKRSSVTIEKLNQISMAALPEKNKIMLLKVLGCDDNIRDTWGMPRGDKSFICWIAKEVWMSQLLDSGCALLDGILGNQFGEHIVLPDEPSLRNYFEDIKVVHRNHLFERLAKDMAVAQSDRALQVDMDKASRRLIFRYLKYLQINGLLKSLPPITKAWLSLEGNASMFLEYMLKDKVRLSDWERKNCPWWLDMVGDHCLDEEREYLQKHKKGTLVQESSSSEYNSQVANMQQEFVESMRQDARREQVGRPKKRRMIDLDVGDGDNTEVQESFDTIARVSRTKKRIFDAVYLSLDSIVPQYWHSQPVSEIDVLICDYISLGGLVKKGKTDMQEFQAIRDFFKRNASRGCRRSGKDCAWSVNAVFIDLPTGHDVLGVCGKIPSWNALKDDHSMFSLGLSSALLDDFGWIILFASLNSVSAVERHAKAVGLTVFRRFVVIDASPFGEC